MSTRTLTGHDNGEVQRAITLALEATETIQDLEGQARALSAITTMLSETGDVAQALRIADTIKDLMWRVITLSAIATAQAKAGNRAAARRTLLQAREAVRAADRVGQKTRDPEQRAWALGSIAKALVEVGDVGQALKIARTIEKPGERLSVLGDIATTQVKVGDRAAARQTLLQAREVVRAAADPEHNAWALGSIAEALVEVGDVGQALKTARTIEKPEERAKVLIDVAIASAYYLATK